MTVETTTRKTTQSMTIAVVEYDFSFRALIATPSDIKCIRQVTSTAVDTDMTYVTEIPAPSDATDVLEYTVDINDDGVGGTVTVAWPSTSCTITIYRETTDTQSSDYEDYNQFPAETVETDFDRRTMKSQEIDETLDRTLKYSVTAGTGSTLPSGEANTYLGWNSTGTLLENKTIATGGTILVRASEAEAIAGTDNNKYMTPLRHAQAASSFSTLNISTTATIYNTIGALATFGNLTVTTEATISNAIIAAASIATVNLSSGTIAGAVTGVTQSSGDNSTKIATTEYADALIGGTGIPVATILPFAAPTAPTGWLLCYGQAVSRTVTYSTLFAAIGIAYGGGDATTTFNVPDLRGRVPLGADNMGGSSADRVTSTSADTIGLGSGAETHTLTTAELAAHTHTAGKGAAAGSYAGFNATAGSYNQSYNTGSAGSGTAHNNVQPYQTINYIIKY